MAIRDKTTTNKWTYERSHKSLNSYSLVEYNKIYPNTNSWKTLQEESLRQVDFDNLYFWNTLNKTHQGILVWNRNIRLHTSNKKHVYKERKETTHVEVGEEDIHHHIYISKISTMYINMVTRPVYKKKEVCTPPNKIKHISPLQRHVFLPLICRILKKNHIFFPFLSWLTNGTRSYKALPEKHKDDQEGTRNPYKCLNVMK